MYNPEEISCRIKSELWMKQITAKQMTADIGLGINAMSQMRDHIPQADTLAKIADYLNVSVDYLLGRTDKKEVNR